MLQEKMEIYLKAINVDKIKITYSVYGDGTVLFAETKDNLQRIFYLLKLIMK
jgi:hypothetical protein